MEGTGPVFGYPGRFFFTRWKLPQKGTEGTKKTPAAVAGRAGRESLTTFTIPRAGIGARKM